MHFITSLNDVIDTIRDTLICILKSSHADTTIIKTVLNVVDRPVTILADDTDILCLLLHHVYFHNDCQGIFLKTMRTPEDTQERISMTSLKLVI